MKNRNRRFFIITGPRRVGKTSFLKATLNEIANEYGYNAILIDVRTVTSMNSNYPENLIATELERVLTGNNPLKKIFTLLRIDVNLFGVLNISKKEDEKPTLAGIFDALGSVDDTVIIAFDEAQELRGSVNDLRLLFASVLDNYDNIKLVFTGSQAGLLEKYLAVADGDSPLYGRFEKYIRIPRFSPNETIRFLEEGFKQNGFEDYDLDELILTYDEVAV